jgi:hypothetical protein
MLCRSKTTIAAIIGKSGFEVLKVDVISHSKCFCFKEKQNKKGLNSDIVRVREVSEEKERERERNRK